jgi:type VI protein secretion system component VasF
MITNSMDANDSIRANEKVIRVPFWLVALVSAVLLMAGYAVYYFLTGGSSN